MQRLMESAPYSRDETRFPDYRYDPNLVTMLVRCYRMHREILRIPNAAFYHGDLVPSADPVLTESLAEWDGLPSRGFPLIFEGIDGEDIQEASSPSWFNPGEAAKVLDYIQRLQEARPSPVCAKDIGVVTPYQKQVQKIRLLRKAHGLGEV